MIVLKKEFVDSLPSLAGFARQIGYSQSAVYNAFYGLSRCSSEMIEAILRATGKPFEELFEIIDDPGPYKGRISKRIINQKTAEIRARKIREAKAKAKLKQGTGYGG